MEWRTLTMTDHLTRHGTENDEDVTGRADVRESDGFHDYNNAGDPAQDRDTDQNLSTADLASASAGRQDADESGGDVETPAESGGDVETPASSGGDVETPAGSGGDVETPARSGDDVETPTLIDEEKVTGF